MVSFLAKNEEQEELMMGSGQHISLKEKADIVKMFLPDCPLDKSGRVVESETCPLCGGTLDIWTTTHTIIVNGAPTLVHQICPKEDR